MYAIDSAFFKKNIGYVVINLLENNKSIVLRVTGHCMKPFLREDDLISVRPIPINKLRCGDIVLYHINGMLKCHRFIEFITIQEKQYLITKSDRRLGYDAPVPTVDFLGIIIRIKKGERIVNYETKKWKRINYCLGKSSPFLSKAEYYTKCTIRFPRMCVSRIFRMVMGTNFRAYMEKRTNIC